MKRLAVGVGCLVAVLLAFCARASGQEVNPVERWKKQNPKAADSTQIVVEGAERMDPVQRIYSIWGAEVLKCLREEWGKVRLRQGVEVWTATRIEKDGHRGAGLWLAPKTIVLLEEDVASEQVVKHELAHVYCQSCPHHVIRKCARADSCLKAGGV